MVTVRLKKRVIACVKRDDKAITTKSIMRRLLMLLKASPPSPTTVFIAKTDIGPRSGDRSIAPIMIATLFMKSPMRAIIPAIEVNLILLKSSFK